MDTPDENEALLAQATWALQDSISKLLSYNLNKDSDSKYDGYGLEQLIDGHALDYSNIFTDLNWEPKYNLYGLDQNRRYDYIFCGCSETEGSFLTSNLKLADNPYHKRVSNYSEFSDLIWGNIVGKYLGLDALNLSFGGASVSAIVDRFISYCTTNGAPKVVTMLLPTLTTRIHTAQDLSRFRTDPAEEDTSTVVSVVLNNVSAVRYSKAPHLITDILPPLTVMYHNIRMLKILESYCAAAGIVLVYSSWSHETHYILSEVNRIAADLGLDIPFKKYIDTKTYVWREAWLKDLPKEISECHYDLHDANRDLFWKGSDGQHMGTHRHRHIADEFIDNLHNMGSI